MVCLGQAVVRAGVREIENNKQNFVTEAHLDPCFLHCVGWEWGAEVLGSESGLLAPTGLLVEGCPSGVGVGLVMFMRMNSAVRDLVVFLHQQTFHELTLR